MNMLKSLRLEPGALVRLEKLIDRSKAIGYDFIPSYFNCSNPYSLFFYHVPKTGGLRFLMPIAFCIRSVEPASANPVIKELLGSPFRPITVDLHALGFQNMADALGSTNPVFYSDHQLGFPMHSMIQSLQYKTKSISALRHPKKDWNLQSSICFV